MSWSCLPEELWKLLLTYVSFHERLGSCSRVSQKLCRAAAAATEQLEVQLGYNVERAEGLKRWLHLNDQHVSSLQLEGLSGDLTQLPCPKLQQLCVKGGAVLLGSSSNHPGILHSCSSLTRLELLDGMLLDVSQSLSGLSAVPALQHLELCSRGNTISMPGSILQALTRLALLRLCYGIVITAESLQHISALQHLQVLDIVQPRTPLSPSSTPGLAQLTALTSLRLHYADVDVALFHPYRNLQSLVFGHCTLSGGTNAATTLLSVIGQQSQLQQLVLSHPRCQWPTAPSAYTALTASSRLQHWLLAAVGLPAGILQAVFRPEQQLPGLTSLRTGIGSIGADDALFGNGWSNADISRLVGCCPGLCSLAIDLQPDVQLEVLSQLTGLTYLTVYKATDASATSLQCLSGLKELNVIEGDALSPEALLQLSTLRGLTSLCVDHPDECDISFSSTDQDPDVWLQLLEHCASISSCQPAIARGLAQQTRQLQQQSSHQEQLQSSQQQLISNLQQQVAEQQQDLVAHQQEMQQLQQQNSDHAAEAAELRGRLAALEGKVAQLMQAQHHRG